MKLYAFLNRSVNKVFSESDVLHGCNIGVGYANGYVAVPPEHPLHGKYYNEANEVIDIHGGLTFSDSVEEIKADGWRNEWLFCLTPTFFIKREDVFNDEKAIYVGIHWLMFQAFIILTKKK